jgi:2-polyprenyl-3-methyl-5-hydroxy-6-metoxy-1,4-benzoquinol methylase
MLLKVGRLSRHIGEDKLIHLFAKVGIVKSATVIRDIYSRRSRGYGFVRMSTRAGGEEAIKRLNGTLLGGLRISVKAPKYQRILRGEMEFKEWFVDHASQVLRKIGMKEGMAILDYGCGTGRFTIPSAKIVGRKGNIYAVDADASVLERVEKEAQKQGLKNIETVLCGTSDLSTGLGDESVDAILVYDVMHQISDRKGLLKELNRVLRFDGFLSIFPMHMGTKKAREIMNECDLFCFRDSYGLPGYKAAIEILNFTKVNGKERF